jgi:xanthine dehydrogenase accessory factor
MRAELLRLAAELAAREEPFALALVIRRQPASSSQVGDAAVVTAAGEVRGWLGGSCTEPTLVGEAMRALSDGRPRLVALAPDPESARRPGVTVFPMTCHSGGSVEIYLEPVLPAPRLLLFGVSPLARALARLGRAAGYRVTVADPAAEAGTFPEADEVVADFATLGGGPDAAGLGKAGGSLARSGPSRPFAVVATMGQSDEEAAAAALALDPAYLGVVASRARAAEIRAALAARGVSPAGLARLKSPAGLALGARTPEEIALSILAEIVQVRRAAEASREAGRAAETGGRAADAGVGGGPPPPVPAPAEPEALDPVCGMTVRVLAGTPRAEHGGRTVYFCCGGCRERFRREPERYLAALAAEAPR